MIPKGISKGKALKTLSEILDIDRDKIIAVGDYFNDIEMLQFAGTGAAVGNAVDEAKAAADIVLCKCEDNAIAEMIGILDKQIT